MPFGSKIQKKAEHTSGVEHTTPANNLGTPSLLQRVSTGANSLLPHDVMHLQRTIGNQAVSQLLGRGRSGTAPNSDGSNHSNARPLIQPQLKVGVANDKYEREAEQIAGGLDFSQKPLPAPVSSPMQGIATVQRSSFAGAEGGAVDADLAGRIQRAQKGGASLSSQVRSKLEPRLGADLASVKVHTGDEAVQVTREVGAKAFTHKNHIYYGRGQLPNDLRLTTHEAVHTIQQGSVRQVQRKRDSESNDSPATQMGNSTAVAQPQRFSVRVGLRSSSVFLGYLRRKNRPSSNVSKRNKTRSTTR